MTTGEERSLKSHLLDVPWIYRVAQLLLAPGAENVITQWIEEVLARQPSSQHLLDVGCGPSSWLWRVGYRPVGLDILQSYAARFKSKSELAVMGSATALPFPDDCFDGVWSIGLLHHLPDDLAACAIGEMLRVCSSDGYVAIFDAVLPDPPLGHPLAYLLRRIDRGNFMRREERLRALLPPDCSFAIERLTYSSNGLEALVMVHTNQ